MASEDRLILLGDSRDAWPATRWTWFATPDRRLLLASILLQLALGLLLGHANDMRVFMTAGYLAGAGDNPYVPRDLTHVFHHVLFGTRRSIGYPPPWPLVLGGIYRATYGLVHELLLYNLAIKLPVIAANVGLAYLAAATVQNLGSPAAEARRAWTFLLFNPFLLYFTAAWGQIDGIVALGALAALLLLVAGRRDAGAVLLALAVCLKPIALPVALVALIYLATRSWRATLRFALVLLAGVLVLYAGPFFVLGWDPQPATHLWHKVWDMSGTLSYMTILRLARNPLLLPGGWWLLGLAWIPALAVASVYVVRRGIGDIDDLLRACTALVLVFFLTRTWLSEPNVVLVLPFALLLTLRGRLDRRALLALWVIPLLFTVAGWTPLRLLWVAFPGTMEETLRAVERFLPVVLWLRAVLVVVWQVLGWWIVVTCLRRAPAPIVAPAPARAVTS